MRVTRLTLQAVILLLYLSMVLSAPRILPLKRRRTLSENWIQPQHLAKPHFPVGREGWGQQMSQEHEGSPNDKVPGLISSTTGLGIIALLKQFNWGLEYAANGLLDVAYLVVNGVDIGFRPVGFAIQHFWRVIAAIPPGDLWQYKDIHNHKRVRW